MKRVFQNKKAIIFFLFPALFIFLLIIIIPIFMSLFYSTTQWDGTREKVFVGFGNYVTLFSNANFLRAMLHSALFALASVCIQLPLAMLLALVLAKKIKRDRFFVTVYFIPVILASVVIGQLWMRIYNQNYGILNLFLKAIGATKAGSYAWLGEPSMALVAVIIPVLWQYVGYHMLLFYSGIKSISTDIFEAAKIDGASFWRTSFSITIPLLKPVILVSLTFAIIGSMKVYDLVKVLTNGGPAGATEVISTLLVKTMLYPGNQYGYGSAMSIVLIAECFVFYLLLRWLFRDKDDNPLRLGRRKIHG